MVLESQSPPARGPHLGTWELGAWGTEPPPARAGSLHPLQVLPLVSPPCELCGAEMSLPRQGDRALLRHTWAADAGSGLHSGLHQGEWGTLSWMPWMNCVPQIHVLKPEPPRRGLWEAVGSGGRSLVGISALIKGSPESEMPPLSPHEDATRGGAICRPGSWSSSDPDHTSTPTLIVWPPGL